MISVAGFLEFVRFIAKSNFISSTKISITLVTILDGDTLIKLWSFYVKILM